MNYKTLITMILAGTLSAQAAEYQYLTIEKSDGTATSLTAIGLNIAYSSTQLTATNGTETATLALSEVSRMYFSNTKADTATGISTAVNSTTAQETEVYDLSGHRLPQGTALRKGVYIVKENGKTRKVTVK